MNKNKKINFFIKQLLIVSVVLFTYLMYAGCSGSTDTTSTSTSTKDSRVTIEIPKGLAS